jgi:hypothetical protein
MRKPRNKPRTVAEERQACIAKARRLAAHPAPRIKGEYACNTCSHREAATCGLSGDLVERDGWCASWLEPAPEVPDDSVD